MSYFNLTDLDTEMAEWFSSFSRQLESLGTTTAERAVYTEDNLAKVDLVVPGLDRKSLKVTVEGQNINVECYYKIPRTTGVHVKRSYRALRDLDSKSTMVTYSDGIVSVSVPYLGNPSKEPQVFTLDDI